MHVLKVRAQGIELHDGKKYIVCAIENGGGMFRTPLPDDKQGESIEQMVNEPQSVVHLTIEQDEMHDMKIVAISAIA